MASRGATLADVGHGREAEQPEASCQARRVKVGGVPVDAIDRAGMCATLLRDVQTPPERPKLVFSMNGEGVYLYHRNFRFRRAIDQADLVHADGMSVVRAGNRGGKAAFAERVATTDLFHDIARSCEQAGITLFFVGCHSDVLERAARNVREQYPGLQLLGTHHGYFERDSAEEQALLERLRALQPDVIFVGFGRVAQEDWCLHVRDRLAGTTWLKTCGGMFPFLANDVPRAPRWMQRACLEWLYRLCREPRRLFWRYLVTNVYSLYCYWFRR